MSDSDNKIPRVIGWTAALVAVALICWYFRHIVIYLAVAAVLSLIGRPLRRWLEKLHVKNVKVPCWLASLITLIFLFIVFFSVFLLIAPLAGQITRVFTTLNLDTVAGPLSGLNNWIKEVFPKVGPDFRIEVLAMEQLVDLVNVTTVSSFVSSISTLIADVAISLFSIFFITYFCIYQEGLITEAVAAIVPKKLEQKVITTSKEVSTLLSRYFIGILIESVCIMLLNGLGLTLLAKMEVGTAVIVAVLTGIINVVPYLGPLAGEVLAVMMALVTRSSAGFNGSLGVFLLVVLIVCLTTQLIDNYVFQPVIYSSSVKAHPLEIFLVILMAAHVWGVIGMLVAVPGYTVLRVIAGEFFSEYRFVQILTQKIHEVKIKK